MLQPGPGHYPVHFFDWVKIIVLLTVPLTGVILDWVKVTVLFNVPLTGDLVMRDTSRLGNGS